MTLRVQAKVVGVDVGPHPASPSTLDAFEHQLALFNQANEPTGNAVRAVMLCNPHNPLGFNYPRDTLVAYARFCEKHNLHLVSDEIYALTQFENPDIKDEEHVPFTSILAVDVLEEAGCNPARVHVLYGAAKDFGMNGARLGEYLIIMDM
jgi:1-aminocyclopropane-1-carboxylate synthase